MLISRNLNLYVEINKNKEKFFVYLFRDIGVVGKSEVLLMKLNGIIFVMVMEYFINGY